MNQEQIDQVKQLKANGVGVNEIIKLTGATRYQVYKALGGVRRGARGPNLAPAVILTMKRMFDEGKSNQQISKATGFHESTVSKVRKGKKDYLLDKVNPIQQSAPQEKKSSNVYEAIFSKLETRITALIRSEINKAFGV